MCLHLLEELIISRTVFDQILFGEYKLGLIPFDTDILSLEMDGCFKQVCCPFLFNKCFVRGSNIEVYQFRQCSVDGDLSSLTVVAQALLKVQMLFGVIPNVRSKGHCAKKVLQKMMSLRVEEVEQEQKLLQEQQSSLNSTQVPTGGAGGDGNGSEKNFVDSASSAKSNAGGTRTAKRVADKYNSRSEIDLLVM